MDHTDSIFSVRDVWYAYKNVSALNGISLEVKKGERVALLGPNGSGKSTLLRVLAALSFPQRGEVLFTGETLTEERFSNDGFSMGFRRRVGIVFQNPDVQLFNASVVEEVAFGPLQMRWPKEKVRESVDAVLAQLGIAELRDRPPHRLSGGEKKRVALASVLVLDPEVILLDEPTAGLDPESQNELIRLLSSWAGSSRTIVISTHDLDTLEDVADRCYILNRGQVAGEGGPYRILHDVDLLERTSLLRPHRHVHEAGLTSPHPHIHADRE
ncbi:MAG: energy-coupling factor ABC transporter ATP-binding protein [Bryobacteraceae bacterium]